MLKIFYVLGGVHDELDIVNSIMLTDNYLLALINEKQLNFKVPVLSCFFNLELLTMVCPLCFSPLLSFLNFSIFFSSFLKALEKGLRICLSPLLEKIKRMEDLNVFEDKSTLRRKYLLFFSKNTSLVDIINLFSLILYGIIGLLISPLTAVLVMVFVLLEYGEQFKNSPGQLLGNDIYCLRAQFSHLLGVQDWSLLARYKFRDYNELQHLFEARMKKVPFH